MDAYWDADEEEEEDQNLPHQAPYTFDMRVVGGGNRACACYRVVVVPAMRKVHTEDGLDE